MIESNSGHAWFGEPWGAGFNDIHPQVPVPVGTSCFFCREPFRDGDQGFRIPHDDEHGSHLVDTHRRCMLVSVGLDSSRAENPTPRVT